ncbi:MAG: hypothetical protein ABJC09_09160, partial [Terriglobia bacterium]
MNNHAPQRPPRLSAAFRIGITVVLAIMAVVLCFVVYAGIESRVRAEADLKQTTLDAAIPTVAVTHPKLETRGDEIALPGNVQ